MTHVNSIAIGALSRAQLARLLEILEPFRHERLSAPVITLAARLARMEAAS